MAELERLGLPGPTQLRELLTTCEDPAEAIQNFQKENGIQVHSLKPALKLIELHGVRRLEFHETVLNDLQDRLVNRIRHLGRSSDKKNLKLVENLLSQSFPLVKVPQIRPVVLETLRNLPKIPPKILEAIQADSELYKECSVEVRQQLWIQNEPLFESEIQPIFKAYIKERSAILRQVEISNSAYFSGTPKSRRQEFHVQNIVKILGEYDTLYDKLLQYIRKGFLATKSPHFCSLRFELLMALHDADVKPLTDIDPCHNFAWCLDPCIRDKHLDPKHAGELKTFLDSMKRQREEVWGDVAMISGDPHVMHFFASLAVKVLKQSVAHETLPRDQGSLFLVLRVLSLGSVAWKMQKDRNFKEPRPESIIFTKFLPNLMQLVTEDSARIEISKSHLVSESLSEESMIQADSASWISEIRKPIIDFIKTEPLAAWLWMYYVVDLCGKRKSNLSGLTRALPLLAVCSDNLGFCETFLHLIVSKLAAMGSKKSVDFEQTGTLIFNGYLLKGMDLGHVKWHLLSALYHLGARMRDVEVESLIGQLERKIEAEEEEGEESGELDELGGVLAKVQQRIAAVKAEESRPFGEEEGRKEEMNREQSIHIDITIPTTPHT